LSQLRVDALTPSYSSLILHPLKAMAKSWDPLRDLLLLQDRMNRLFDDATQRRAQGGAQSEPRDFERADWSPASDVYNREGEYSIQVDLPGIERSSLDISLEDDRLMIRGERKVEGEAERNIERPHGRFLKKFGPLPSDIDSKAIKAEYKDGVLTLRLPKRKEQKSRRVEIKVS